VTCELSGHMIVRWVVGMDHIPKFLDEFVEVHQRTIEEQPRKKLGSSARILPVRKLSRLLQPHAKMIWLFDMRMISC